MKEDFPFYVALSQVPGIGPRHFQILLKAFKKARNVWEAPEKVLEKILEKKIYEEFRLFRDKTDPTKKVAAIIERRIKIITLLDPAYPERLKQISTAPPVLYVKGELTKKDAFALAVVGTRKVTTYGREVTEILVEQLAHAGLTIVSGLARGVDSIAHQTAIKAGGRTIAVLGCGVDIVYPVENFKLAADIEKNGALISEFPPGFPPVPANFPVRNRIISGLSLGTLVTEADEKSGSLITADFALEQNREVFAVPGPIYSRLSKGPAGLIKQGAKLVTSASDVLEELNLNVKVRQQEARETLSSSVEETSILKILENGPLQVDQIIRESGFTSDKLASLLTTMELKGSVKNLGGGNYTVDSRQASE